MSHAFPLSHPRSWPSGDVLLSLFYHGGPRTPARALGAGGGSSELKVKVSTSITDPYFVPVALLVTTYRPSSLSLATRKAGVITSVFHAEIGEQSSYGCMHGATPVISAGDIQEDPGPLALRKTSHGALGEHRQKVRGSRDGAQRERGLPEQVHRPGLGSEGSGSGRGGG